MLSEIADVLDAARLHEVQALLAGAEFVDGKRSAGAFATAVKRNEELDPQDATVAALNRAVLAPLFAHPGFQSAALPLRLSGAFYARYRADMRYGAHLDDAVMGPVGGQRYRCDVAITVFLNAPQDYAGGELVIDTDAGPRALKPAAGTAVVYPASFVHHVAPVTRGERLVAVAWAQSLVRDAARRALLHELDRARAALRNTAPGAEATLGVDRSYMNLLRMWSEV